MAANNIEINKQKLDIEGIVNRWLFDYYVFLAVDAFKNDKYSDFCGIRDVLDSLLSRPMESTDVIKMRIQVLQFLSRINDGDRLDFSFDSDVSITPLESAMKVLRNMGEDCGVLQEDLDKIHSSVAEMLVVICIKNNDFEKAKQVLKKHFPKGMVGKKAIFMGLVNQKSKTHEILEHTTYQQFKQDMVRFCEGIYPASVPFLYKAATQLIDKRHLEQGDNAEEPQPEEEDTTASCSDLQDNTVQSVPLVHFNWCNTDQIQRSRLEVAYTAMAGDSVDKTFVQVKMEVEREDKIATNSKDNHSMHSSPSPLRSADTEQNPNMPPQIGSGSPMEASPADQAPVTDAATPAGEGPAAKGVSPPRSRRLYTVAQLVVEPDSQLSSQELVAEDEAQKLTQPPAATSPGDAQGPLTVNGNSKSTQRSDRQASCTPRKSSKTAVLSADSDDDPLGSVDARKTPVRKVRKRIINSPHCSSTSDSEVNIDDSSLDTTPSQKCSSPQISVSNKGATTKKRKQLYTGEQIEVRETWSDEESLFSSNIEKEASKTGNSISRSGNRKKFWSDEETQMLRDAVAKYGEGKWSKMLARYPFEERTSVNLKDRWRTMKKLNLV